MLVRIEKKRFWCYGVVVALIFTVDRITKLAIDASIPLHSSRSVIEGFFNLVHTRNTGIAFSLFADSSPVIREIVIPAFSVVAVVLVVVLFFQSGSNSWRLQLGLMLVLAGALGNLYDRALYGFVVDFLDFYIGDYHWPAFNVADSSITTGAGLLVFDSISLNRQK